MTQRAYWVIKHKVQGFTIVELLIVVVVIAILAAITIVTYNGITQQANDTAVKNDLANFAKRVEILYVENSQYPEGTLRYESTGVSTGTITSFPPALRDFKPSKGSYVQVPSGGTPNFIYCTGVRTDTGQPGFSLIAKSTSQKLFRYSSMSGIQQITGAENPTTACLGIDYPRSVSYGYLNSSWYVGG